MSRSLFTLRCASCLITASLCLSCWKILQEPQLDPEDILPEIFINCSKRNQKYYISFYCFWNICIYVRTNIRWKNPVFSDTNSSWISPLISLKKKHNITSISFKSDNGWNFLQIGSTTTPWTTFEPLETPPGSSKILLQLYKNQFCL